MLLDFIKFHPFPVFSRFHVLRAFSDFLTFNPSPLSRSYVVNRWKPHVGVRRRRGFFFSSSPPQTPPLLLTRERTHTDLRLYGAETQNNRKALNIMGYCKCANWEEPRNLGIFRKSPQNTCCLLQPGRKYLGCLLQPGCKKHFPPKIMEFPKSFTFYRIIAHSKLPQKIWSPGFPAPAWGH